MILRRSRGCQPKLCSKSGIYHPGLKGGHREQGHVAKKSSAPEKSTYFQKFFFRIFFSGQKKSQNFELFFGSQGSPLMILPNLVKIRPGIPPLPGIFYLETWPEKKILKKNFWKYVDFSGALDFFAT